MYFPPHYARWRTMKARCYNKNVIEYQYYGARGVYVCAEWLNFFVFRDWCEKTFQPGKTLDRVDVNGPYAPWNCRWASHSEQAKNRRRTPELVQASRHNLVGARGALKKIYGDPKKRTRKKCGWCGEVKSLKFFPTHKNRADGTGAACLECMRQYQREYYRRKKDAVSRPRF